MNSNTRQNSKDALLESYISAYRAIHTKSCFSTKEQDVVVISMFFEKGSLHCMDAHSTISASLIPSDAIDDVREKEKTIISDEKLRALSAFSRIVASSSGYSKNDIKRFFESGYAEKQLLCVIAIHGILTWNNFFSRIYEEPLKGISQNRIQSIAEIKTLEIITLAS